MNWDALGAMGEIAGAIAVIATLFFLARQLQVNTRELEKTNEYQRTTSVVASNEIYNEVWCPGPDSNRHGILFRGILSPLCLPISPPGRRR